MNARVKMPPGRRDRSLRSSASSDMTEMRVLPAICLRVTPRFSRASRRRAPTVRAGEPWGISLRVRSMLGNRPAGVKRPSQVVSDCLQVPAGGHSGRRHEEPDAGDAGGPGASQPSGALHGDPTNRQDRNARSRATRRTQFVQGRQSTPLIFRWRWIQRAENQVVDAAGARRCARFVGAVDRPSDDGAGAEQRARRGHRRWNRRAGARRRPPRRAATSARSFTSTFVRLFSATRQGIG